MMNLQDLERFIKESEKITNDRLEYGYDSICLRIEAFVFELAILKAKTSDNHR